MHVTWCSSLLSPPLLRGYCNRLCPFVRPSVCYALSSLTIGRNPTKFGVRDFHMSEVCGSTIFGPSPWGPGEGSKVNYQIRKVDFKIFIPNFMFVLKNKRNGIFIMSPGSYSRGWDLGLLGGKFFFPNMVMWHIKLKGMVSRTGNKLNVPRSAHHSLQFDMPHDHVWKKN